MQRHSWRRAASYIYLYSAQLRIHGALRDPQRRSFILQERLNGLSAAINALQLVHPAYAWIDAPLEETCSNMYPSKKARITVEEQCKLYFKIYLIFSKSFSFLNYHYILLFGYVTSIFSFSSSWYWCSVSKAKVILRCWKTWEWVHSNVNWVFVVIGKCHMDFCK